VTDLAPFRFRNVGNSLLLTNELGDFGFFDENVLDRLFSDTLQKDERQRLRDLSITLDGEEWRLASLMRRARQRYGAPQERLSYLIVVPTLRCDLACSYCQVSRAAIDARGFDWTEQHLAQFERFLDRCSSTRLKVEFQGGEPTLRPDLIQRVIDICGAKFPNTEFAICTNLTRIPAEMEPILARPDVVISTSIDGPLSAMTANRTGEDSTSAAVFNNFQRILDTYGPKKISALPTVTEAMIAHPKELVDCYQALGFQSIFLRPVNYVGFARKRHGDLSLDYRRWDRFYREALDHIVALNRDGYFEEFYLSLLVRAVFGGLEHGYVDLRSPSRYATDYCVIDYDGTLYPTDEARMLSRTRSIDLSIGTLANGFDPEKLNLLNMHAVSQVHPDCTHCAYMPFCGIDVIDDISRYGRSDLPKQDTWFCRRQMSLFDLIFEKVAQRDMAYLQMFLKWIYRRADPPPTYELFYD